jgi:hypothetical protein
VDSFASNLNILGPYDYIFTPLQNSGELLVGNGCDPTGCSVGTGAPGLVVVIFGGATSSPTLDEFAYSIPPTSVLFASALTLRFTEVVPEPSSWLLLCVGLASLVLFTLLSRCGTVVGRSCERRMVDGMSPAKPS